MYQAVLKEIRDAINALPPELKKTVTELAEYIQRQIRAAGEPVGSLALALAAAEQAKRLLHYIPEERRSEYISVTNPEAKPFLLDRPMKK